MQEQPLHVAEPGGRRAQQFAGVDLRRPKGYAAPSPPPAATAAPAAAATAVGEGEPCPRCESRDTKFCYYNNYNTSQPRHFCKCCRRYWTKGGTLRNVPVGGGTRKKSSSSSSSSPSSSSGAGAKRQKPSKKRRVAPPDPATSVDVVTAPDSTKTTETTTTPPNDAASEITTELVVPAVEEDSFTDLLQPDAAAAAVALGPGFSDYPAGCKALLDPDSFEWPPAFDLGAYWSAAGFADPDPGVFLNLP